MSYLDIFFITQVVGNDNHTAYATGLDMGSVPALESCSSSNEVPQLVTPDLITASDDEMPELDFEYRNTEEVRRILRSSTR